MQRFLSVKITHYFIFRAKILHEINDEQERVMDVEIINEYCLPEKGVKKMNLQLYDR